MCGRLNCSFCTYHTYNHLEVEKNLKSLFTTLSKNFIWRNPFHREPVFMFVEERDMTGMVMITKGGGCGGKISRKACVSEAQEQQNQLSLVALLLATLRKSVSSSCRLVGDEQGADEFGPGTSSFVSHHMEIGWPTDVQHLTHVTFDRFHGFLGLPVEFLVEIPCRVPSARSLSLSLSLMFYHVQENEISICQCVCILSWVFLISSFLW